MKDINGIRGPMAHSRLRLAFLAGIFPSLSETFVVNQIIGMKARGHDVRIFADRPEDAVRLPEEADRHGLRDLTRYVEPAPAGLNRVYQRLPWRVRSPWFDKHARRLDQRALTDCDAVICNFGWFARRLCLEKARSGGDAKVVAIFHGADLSRDLMREGEAHYMPVFEHADLILAISAHWHDALIALGAPPERTFVHRMGVDTGGPAAANAASPRPADGPCRFLTVGRLVEKKGVRQALEGFARLAAQSPDLDWEYVIVGDGEQRAELETLTGRLGLFDRVRFAGPQSNDEVWRLLSRSDVFVLPSVSAADGDMEGIPVALMEAMASGVPAVSTYHSGIPELIENGVDGLLARERDTEALAAHFRRLIGDPALRRELGLRARDKVLTSFDQERQNDLLDRRLHQICAAPPHAGAADARPTGPPSGNHAGLA